MMDNYVTDQYLELLVVPSHFQNLPVAILLISTVLGMIAINIHNILTIDPGLFKDRKKRLENRKEKSIEKKCKWQSAPVKIKKTGVLTANEYVIEPISQTILREVKHNWYSVCNDQHGIIGKTFTAQHVCVHPDTEDVVESGIPNQQEDCNEETGGDPDEPFEDVQTLTSVTQQIIMDNFCGDKNSIQQNEFFPKKFLAESYDCNCGDTMEQKSNCDTMEQKSNYEKIQNEKIQSDFSSDQLPRRHIAGDHGDDVDKTSDNSEKDKINEALTSDTTLDKVRSHDVGHLENSSDKSCEYDTNDNNSNQVGGVEGEKDLGNTKHPYNVQLEFYVRVVDKTLQEIKELREEFDTRINAISDSLTSAKGHFNKML